MVNYKNREWTTLPPTDGMFALWSVLSPSDPICVREKQCPDFYAAVVNERDIRMADLHFNPAITLAVAADIPGGAELFETAIRKTEQLCSAVMVARRVRPWGLETDHGYNRGISETSWFSGSLAGRNPDAGILEESWDDVIAKTKPM